MKGIKIMKKHIFFLTAVFVVSSLMCACSNNSNNPSSNSVESSDSSVVSSQNSASESNTSIKLVDVYADIQSQVTLPDMVALDSTKKLDRYYGIQEDDVADYTGGINNSGVEQDEIVLIKAVSDEAAVRIKESLENRYQAKINENKNYNPEQAAMIEKCKVEQNGLYISMIISSDADKITEIYKNALG